MQGLAKGLFPVSQTLGGIRPQDICVQMYRMNGAFRMPAQKEVAARMVHLAQHRGIWVATSARFLRDMVEYDVQGTSSLVDHLGYKVMEDGLAQLVLDGAVTIGNEGGDTIYVPTETMIQEIATKEGLIEWPEPGSGRPKYDLYVLASGSLQNPVTLSDGSLCVFLTEGYTNYYWEHALLRGAKGKPSPAHTSGPWGWKELQEAFANKCPSFALNPSPHWRELGVQHQTRQFAA